MRLSFVHRHARRMLAGSLALLAAGAALSAAAASVTVQVLDVNGAPVPNAVVYAEPTSGQAVPKSLKPAEVEQKDVKFFPLVSVVQVGTPILFPNHDKVRHHVYSFSPAKTFELKLYSGVPTSPILFDKVGTVVLGCNIHDQMVAYVQVVNTPFFGKTDMAGRVKLDGLVNGKYALKAWYFKMAPNEAAMELPITYQGADLQASVKLNVKAVPVD
ncbi:methylamine utilization protein [Herbaspirillum sp. NPDC101396]|uniref:methylamine utilization protein n=1 Tax=Herbaspirillum sp. NPDC101396 TaxID=3364005 RepID=UPI00383B0B79